MSDSNVGFTRVIAQLHSLREELATAEGERKEAEKMVEKMLCMDEHVPQEVI